MTTAIQAIFVREYEDRPTPKLHTVYKIEIKAYVRSWLVWKRYSEFDELDTDLTKATGSSPPAKLPPKHCSIFRNTHNARILEERKAGLETYLRAIVSAKDDKWRDSYPFRAFLGIPVGRQGTAEGGSGAPTQYSPASWLDEHLELQTRIRDVRAEINKRDALSDRGDINGSHKANVDAKRRLAGVLTRIGALGAGLVDLGKEGMSKGEMQRRTDMVAKLQDDCEKLAKMVTVARAISPMMASSSARNPAPESDRAALLGGGPKPFTRVFGAPPVAKETEETRPLDDTGLLQLQNQQIEQQDVQLSQLTTILLRQRQLGEAIGHEVGVQIEMLSDLDNEVDRVGGKLTTADRKLGKI